jgi:predicted nucleic acid-binding protein
VGSAPELLLYLDQNYLSGIVKRKPAFRELEPVLRAAVARGAVAVPESEAHRLESAARPDLALLELLRELSAGLTLPVEPDAVTRECERRLERVLARHSPDRRTRARDRVDLRALATALPHCRLVTCDAFMADVIRRTRLDLRFRTELFTGRRPDVERLTRRLEGLDTLNG